MLQRESLGVKQWNRSLANDHDSSQAVRSDPQMHAREDQIHRAYPFDWPPSTAVSAKFCAFHVIPRLLNFPSRWARYGEYSYCPTQRWLHNVEHGAIVGLYHPCADPALVEQLKRIIKGCLFRHVITPYVNLTAERPIAVVGWSATLEMSFLDPNLTMNFIKFYAKTGPERVFRDGQYRHLLVEKAKYVTNVIDSELCPHMWERLRFFVLCVKQ